MMLRRALTAARPLSKQATPIAYRPQARHVSASMGVAPEVKLAPTTESPSVAAEGGDPLMNGDYPNPPRVKRSMRDPYDEWWDPQERRNFNEPVHEDNDILGVFSTDPYTHFTPRWGWVLMGSFVATFLGLCAAVRVNYPDKPSVRKQYVGGLEAELGGPGALPALKEGEES